MLKTLSPLLLLSLFLVACVTSPTTGPIPSGGGPRGEGLEVYFFSLGQADSMLVIGPAPARRTLLMDLGEDRWGDRQNYARVARRIQALTGKAEVDYFLISHYHADHMGDVDDRGKKRKVGGLFGVMEDPLLPFHIGTLLDRGDEGEDMAKRTGPHRDLLEHVNGWLESGRLGQRQTVALGTHSINLGAGVQVNVVSVNGRFAPDEPSVMEEIRKRNPTLYASAPANENDFSVALILKYGEFELFTGGDLTGAPAPEPGMPYGDWSVRSFDTEKVTYTNVEGPLARYLRSAGREADVEVYRADHHGSGHSSVPELLNLLDPEFSVFSTGGQYGHPDKGVVERLSRTSRVMITSGIARKTWPAGLTVAEAKVVGEIAIRVDRDGQAYALGGKRYRAFSDEVERGEAREEGSGGDVGEERKGRKSRARTDGVAAGDTVAPSSSGAGPE